MISKASVKFVRISPRKVRYVIDLIRRKSVREAQGILGGTPRRAGLIVGKLLDQAVDAAQKNSQVAASDLVVSRVTADGGPVMKRFRPMSMGRAGAILKRTSHITLELDLAKRLAGLPAAPKAAGKTATQKTRPSSAPAASKQAASAKKPHKKLVGAK